MPTSCNTTTISTFKYIDSATYSGKPWIKIDCPDRAFAVEDHQKLVYNVRGRELEFTTDNCGFQVVNSPSLGKVFNGEALMKCYYDEVRALLRAHLPGNVKEIYIFDHTIRRRQKDFPRQPVEQVHCDQTADATVEHIRRLTPAEDVNSILERRYQIVNVWRPIEFPASDYPLAVLDWRTTVPEDFVTVDALFPKCNRTDSVHDDQDMCDLPGADVPDVSTYGSIEGYEIRDEVMAVKHSGSHRWYYLKDMTPDEVMLLKCYDSFGEGQPLGVDGIAVWTPHSAFVDPGTPFDAPGRQSIEVRCLVCYE